MQRALGVASFVLAVGLGLFVLKMLGGPPAIAGPVGSIEQQPAPSAPAPKSNEPPLRVLFVGNSHTYFNDMPKMIAQLAEAAHERPLAVEMITVDAAHLRDHVARGEAAAKMRDGGFHVLVLQEQQQVPSFESSHRKNVMDGAAQVLAISAQSAGMKTFLSMTWARKGGDPSNVPGDTFAAMHERSVRGHVECAQSIGAKLVPASIAWKRALELRPTLELWRPDGSHPTVAGSYLAACVLYRALYERSPAGNAFTAGLPATDAAFLQELAANTQPPQAL
jgi:hypothetical protein